ncbi:MAG: hypothetical protein AVDCRST_MAG29-548, partial [uncultured Nocardioidaceae bacterium]
CRTPAEVTRTGKRGRRSPRRQGCFKSRLTTGATRPATPCPRGSTPQARGMTAAGPIVSTCRKADTCKYGSPPPKSLSKTPRGAPSRSLIAAAQFCA